MVEATVHEEVVVREEEEVAVREEEMVTKEEEVVCCLRRVEHEHSAAGRDDDDGGEHEPLDYVGHHLCAGMGAGGVSGGFHGALLLARWYVSRGVAYAAS